VTIAGKEKRAAIGVDENKFLIEWRIDDRT
jgi:hypothetical protein